MFLFAIFTIAVVAVVILSVIAIGIVGSVGIVLFADVFVCALIFAWLIKCLTKKKS